jgi:hypothetical protein
MNAVEHISPESKKTFEGRIGIPVIVESGGGKKALVDERKRTPFPLMLARR